MKIERKSIQGEGFAIPCVLLTPPDSRGAAVAVHGYGGCKEEQLGLAWRLAETGLTACAIDLHGHGEHELSLDGNVIQDVETAILYCRQFGKVVAVGHSLGGRLSLLSSADYKIGLSPALGKTFSKQTQEMLKALRGYRVRETDSVFEVLNRLPEWQKGYDGDPALIIVGSRDVPDILAASSVLRDRGVPVMQIDQALHNDIFLLEPTFSAIVDQLKEWF